MILIKKLYGKMQNSNSSLMLFLLVGSTVLTYYHASAWSLVLSVTIVAVLILFQFRDVNVKGARQNLSFALVLFLFVACLYFLMDRQFYNQIAEQPITEVLINFVIYIGCRLTGSNYPSSRSEYYTFTYDPLGRVLSYFALGMILFSILYTFILLLASIRSKSKTLSDPILIFVGLIVIGLFENFTYFSQSQSFGNRYLQLYAIIIGFYAISIFLNKRSNASKKFWHIAVVILTIFIIGSAFYNAYYSVFRGNVALRSGVPMLCENPSKWLASYVDHGSIVSEHQTSGFLFMDIIRANKSDSVRVFPLNEDMYALYEAIIQKDEQILSKLFNKRTYDIFVFLKIFNQKPMFGDVWGFAVPPLDGKESNLYNFTILNTIYDDGNAVILDFNR